MAAFSDSDEEEAFIKLGTPLPEIADDGPRKKPVSMQDLQAQDSKGRPRFHGAFTGGFSAGYFNTVGSKEGWTPSTFVSSRTKKEEAPVTQRPEDFMDEEDFGEHGIAPRKLVTAGQFTSEERKRRRIDEATAVTQDTAIPGVPALVDLIVPERLSIGVKLLRKMGWKEGQGLGPRISKKQRKLQKAGKKIYGCALPPSSSSDEDDLDDSAVLKDVTFAPRDITPIHLLAKNNTHGLGYSGLNPKSALPSTHISLFEPPAITKTRRKGIRGQAFGVGALEDEDDDIYSTDHMSNYDVTMGGEEDENFGWTAPRNKGPAQTPVGYIGKMLEGFKLSSTPLVQKKHFPPPTLPRNFRPVHVFKKPEEESQSAEWFPGSDVRIPQFRKPDDSENQSGQETPASARGKPQYTDAMSRGVALGEQPFVGSVFDLIPKEDKKRMNEAKKSTTGTKIDERTGGSVSKETSLAGSSVGQEIKQPAKSSQEPVQSSTNRVPVMSQSTQEPVLASLEEQRRNNVPLFQAGAGFKPFMRDPEKQERYEKYLALVKQGHKDPYSTVITPGKTEWETEREREEFARAAKLYKPLAGMMAMRFTTGTQQEDGTKVDVKVEEKIDKCDATKAAEMKMFGKLTRDVLEWHPDRLVCKRFNIPDPYPGSSIVGLATVKRDKFSVFNFLSFPSQTETSQEQLLPLPDSSERSSGSGQSVSQTGAEKAESKVEKELNKSKNMKSIFSHLVETEKGTQKQIKGVSFSVKSVNPNKPKEFKSIFSHLEDSDDKPKRKPVPMETEESKASTSEKDIKSEASSQKKESAKTEPSSHQQEQKASEEDKPEMDLFRAIFRNTDSEDSSSSDEEEKLENSVPVSTETEKDQTSTRSENALITGEERLTSQEGKVEEHTGESVILPGSGEPIPTLEQRLSPSIDQDQSEDEYGPALPPAIPALPNTDSTGTTKTPADSFIDLTESSSSSKKHKHKHKHKSKKDKKEKYKKSKHKKKQKKKEKKKKERREKSSSETADTSGKDTDSEDSSADVPSDKDLLRKMKSLLPRQRLRAADFM